MHLTFVIPMCFI